MNLNEIAQQAMDYLDSVGVAADWEIYDGGNYGLVVMADDWTFSFLRGASIDEVMSLLKVPTQKSPN